MQTPAVAVKLGPSSDAVKGLQIMGIVTCDGCGERFWIEHYSASADPVVAEHQAEWLERVLAHDHERERKHLDKIELP